MAGVVGMRNEDSRKDRCECQIHNDSKHNLG
jgi:hypothetical protein